jgi:cell division protein ZipA
MDIGAQLRWILIACGVLLLAGIYFWGRRYRGRDGGNETIVTSRSEPMIDAPEFDEGFDPSFDEPEVAPEELEPIEHMPLEVRPAYEDVIAPANRASRRDPVISDDNVGLTMPLPVEPAMDPAETAPRREPPVVTTTASEPSIERAPAAANKPGERKIVALRLPAGSINFAGAELARLFVENALTHGKYSIYHRLENDRSVFSVASMVEPGTFDPNALLESEFAGVTMFAVLPGPIDALAAVDAMVAAGRNFEKALGATLQDERGNPLTPRLVSRLRSEVIAYQRTADHLTVDG